MEPLFAYNKGEARRCLFDNEIINSHNRSVAEMVFQNVMSGLKTIYSDQEDLDYDFHWRKFVQCKGTSPLKGNAELQSQAARNFLLQNATDFAVACQLHSNSDSKHVKQYLRNKLLKNTSCKNNYEYEHQENCVINSGHFLRFLNRVRNGEYLTTAEKIERKTMRASEEVATVKKRGSCFPVNVKYLPSAVTHEFFDQVIINGKPFALFRSPCETGKLDINLPEHTVIFLHPLHFKKPCKIRAKSLIVLDDITVSEKGRCSVAAPEKSVNVILYNGLDTKPFVWIKGTTITKSDTASFCERFKNAVEESLSKNEPRRISQVAGALFKLAKYVLQNLPLNEVEKRIPLPPKTTPELFQEALDNSVVYQAIMLQIPRITYL